MRSVVSAITAAWAIACAGSALASAAVCKGNSQSTLTPVIELYTSEGCSSCPPADRWLSGLKTAAAGGRVVVQAFHVAYWDSLGWIDRFAAPAYTDRQREIAKRNGQSGIYTPQLVRNGRDLRDYARALTAGDEPARAQITLQQTAHDEFAATVTPAEGVGAWAAYWTVTEHGHNSKVSAGENSGEFLQHDFVVREYVTAGQYRGSARLTLNVIAAQPSHPRQVNLVVFDPSSGTPLQALSLGC